MELRMFDNLSEKLIMNEKEHRIKKMLDTNGLENTYKIVNNKNLRYGYTTGSCAAAAAKAAAWMLLSEKQIDYINLTTPKGFPLHLEVLDIQKGENYVSCAIEKDSGDDPDITNGIWIYAKVSYGEKNKKDILVTGRVGVGIVTKLGLEQPIGSYAINRVPREMIKEELQKLCVAYQYTGELIIEISAPKGIELAKHTFNPRLGIEGGISILGTTGIVEPMSEAALISSIRLELNQQVLAGKKNVVITPGNYGQAFLKKNFPFSLEQAVKCSNFIGETIDICVEVGIETILFVSHIGKFIKVAGGIFQTHSRNADARMEIITANALLAGANQSLLLKVLQATTTEEAVWLLEQEGYLEKTMEHIIKRIEFYLNRRSYGKINIGAIIFSSELGKRKKGTGELGRTKNVEEIISKMQK